ncbi:MAG: patatin-like phospholipase family protein [Steroidobacteraceae bacterium]|nr:patatin-like phospholipase family protein [Steroidobacteraceae bacterium]
MMIRLVLMAAVAIGCLAGPAAVRADDAPAESSAGRQKIGLVLSGGGARGAAHIGVIRALEQMHVPIDAVAGTSMGAVVGGLYAAGLSGDEIAGVFRELDWQDLLRDRAPRKDLVYRRKQDDRSFLATGGLGIRADDGVVLPLGLVQGQKITQVLRNATMGVADVQDFDRLPTPFRGLATDLESGDAVVLSSGDLATVLRASMSAPGVFAPVDIDGRLLVDGGLVDNLPVDLAREMGVDIVIAVDVSFPLAKRSGLETPLDVTNQMIAIMVRRGTEASRAGLKPGDVLVEPELGRMTSIDFTRMPLVQVAGEAAVQKQQVRLAALALPLHDYAAYVASRTRAAERDVQVAFVRPAPHSEQDSARIEAVFGDMAGRPLDTQELKQKAYGQYGLDRYEAIDYKVVRDGGERGLEIDLRRKSWGPNFLRVGMSIESDYEGGTYANAGARLLMTGVNRLDGELLFDAQLGEDPHFHAELFQPLSLTTEFFVAPAFHYDLETLQIVQDGNRVAQYRIRDTQFLLAVGAELSNWGELRVGLRRGTGSSHVMVGEPVAPEGDFDLGAAYLEFGYDRLDSAYFPRHGQAFRASWQSDSEALGASANADIVEANWLFARSRERNSLVMSIAAGSALDNRVVSPSELFTLGGFLNLSGLPQDALIGTQYGIVRAILYRRISRGGTGLFEFPAYMGASLEAGNVWQTKQDVDFGDLKYGGSAFLAAETPFGPLYLAAGFAEGDTAFYLLLGKTF